METTATTTDVNDRRLPASIREAKEILQSIRLDRGFLGDEHEEELSHLRIETREAVKRLAETARRKTAKYTHSIAGELYSLKSRFVYELLQNADDSDYDKNQGEPCVTISLYPDKVLIETNETGFTIANVKAICDTGESSKKTSAEDKSIGEKGYGFKSVFGVAYKARIQSGHWSFYFQHREGDDGLGMITPIDVDPVNLPVAVNTRIELLLHEDTGDLFQKLSQELSNLHETTIFFLQKIETLVIHIHSNEESAKDTEIKRKIVSDQKVVLDRVVSLTRRNTTEGSNEMVETKFYHVREQVVGNMPLDKHRKGICHSELKLAFPFNPETRLPIIDADGQHVFAYLPLYRKSNLPFLIQGDFITSTSRESLLDCPWNDRLRASIAAAFCSAIRLFYDDDVLRYQWLKYLPVLVASGFESPLFSLIKGQLLEAPVFQTWQNRSPARPLQLRLLPISFIHNHAPLFRDVQEEMYLAPEYSLADYAVLSQIGISYMTQHELLDRLIQDLSSPSSRLRGTPTSDPWHDTCASLLVSMLSSPIDKRVVKVIEGQKIIPLRQWRGDSNAQTGIVEWASATEFGSKPIYFSKSYIDQSKNTTANRISLAIPRGLPIRVVHEESSVSSHRANLFTKLGVSKIAPSTVMHAIFERHSRVDDLVWSYSVETLVSQLRYLFWFRDLRDPITQPLIVASNARGTPPQMGLVTRPFYIKSNGLYDAWPLFRDAPALERSGIAAFVSDDYADAEPESARSYGRSWMQWLEEVVHLRRRPPLLDTSSFNDRLSPFMLCILKCRPVDFIPIIQAHWVAEYRKKVNNSLIVKELLSNTQVQCESTSSTKLSQTYLPTPLLKSEAERIGILEHTPFLRLPAPKNGEDPNKWQFLSSFGVGTQADLGFYLDLLRYVQVSDHFGNSPVLEIISKIYVTIGSLCNWAQASLVMKKLTEARGIYVPSNAIGQRWRQPGDCLWNAPPCISIKSALVNHYGRDKNISTLFQTYLQVKDVDINDCLDQLRFLKKIKLDAKGSPVSHEICADVYQELHKYHPKADLLDHMRQVIESERLIFVYSVWHSPSECLWSNDTSISDKVSIAGIYTDLRGLFVSKLRVKMLTVDMLISDLMKKAKAKPPLETADAKSLIFKINSLLPSGPLDYRLQGKFNELADVKCFPIADKDGHVTLTDAGADFAIVDNRRFGRAFNHEADILDFNLDEVHILRPFLEATDVTDRYLSNLVEEVSDIEGNPTQSSELTIRLQGVAYALFCCAVNFKSSKIVGQDTSLHDSLLRVSVHEADKMGTSLVLKQHGRTIKVPSTKTQLKIDTDTKPWKIYVPQDVKARRSCYSSQLPQAILELLGISGNNATLVVNRLINELHDHDSDLLVLEQFDVLPLSWIERQDAPRLPSAGTPGVDNIHLRSPLPLFDITQSQDHTSTSRSGSPSHSNDPRTPDTSGSSRASKNTGASSFSITGGSSNSTLFGGSPMFDNSPRPFTIDDGTTTVRSASATSLSTFRFGSGENLGSSLFGSGKTSLFGNSTTTHRRSASASPGSLFTFSTPTPALGESLRRPTVQKEKYRALLDNIIKRVSGDNRTWDLNDLAEALPDTVRIPMLFDKDETFGVRTEDHMAHDMKIGAAGEVFVVEKLLAAGLPGFTRDNWLSTIRHEAKVHEKYEDMPDSSPDLPEGSRAEPADIVYADADGTFAKFLKTQDCIGVEDWLEDPPYPKREYFIEVKTTTRTCDTTFYMSKAQHSRMLDMRKMLDKPAGNVYIICRVYNLLSHDIKMRFYVSPGRDEDAPNIAGPASNISNSHGDRPSVGGPFSVQQKPILKFASRGFEARPIK